MQEDLRFAVIVNPDLARGLLANTVAAISIGLGTRLPQAAARQLVDRSGVAIDISSDRPVPILQADAETIRAILLKSAAHEDREAVVAFPAFARAMHVYAEYETTIPNRDLAAEVIDGVGIAGPAKWVRSLTGSLKLLR
ncbi:DUF2000 domain-containing protein [Ochrobactrum teleogrylli]|uniref:DUF2000 domain-containing protein n=1 Tax=Ochrobactrum teleogrylli TaxID=2479765 RepID=A0ABD5JRS5_9HYPH